MSAVTRLVRVSLIEALQQDYVRTARAKGLAEWRVVSTACLRNALIPVMTVQAMQFASLLGGALVTEIIFAWPGIGRLAVQAIQNRDFPSGAGCGAPGRDRLRAGEPARRPGLCRVEPAGAAVTIADLRLRSLALLHEWTAIASVAGNAAGLARMATALHTHLRERLGAEIILRGHAGDAPIVHARIDRGRSKTILLYNMYDVMPADASGWSVPPFVGGVTELAGVGACYVGRGAENNKGPLAGMLVVLATLLDADALDANVEIVIEGQEETGSATLRAYLQADDSPVRTCGAALFPSFCEYGGGAPRVYLGSKGLAHGRIGVTGGAWGGPRRAIHSSNAPWIANPAWRLVQALAALGATHGQMPLPAEARPMLVQLAAIFDLRAELSFRNADRFSIPGDALALLEHVLTANVLNLATLETAPHEGRAVLPSQASARFDLRLAPGADPQAVLARISHCLADYDADLEVEHSYPGHRFAADQPAVAALLSTYHAAGTQPQVWPWTVGAMPASAFARIAPCFLIGGLGHGGNAHGVDEFVTLDGLDRLLGFLLAWLPATAAAIASHPS